MRRRWLLTCRAAGLLAVAATLLRAQPAAGWNDARAEALAQRATERRMTQLADTGLRDYRARARGFVTFLAQSGDGLSEPPRVVKADELQLDILWAAPDRSKQRIVGRRDTLLLPTDINYHRDHLGIIQNNFPEIIRLGDGDEVKDVPHPLSPAGLSAYEFRVSDSVRLRLPDRAIEVYRLDVRPRDDRAARAVGAVFIERETAQLVRMAFSFTRSALKDESLEDVHVILENSLVENRFWLPRRQEIEIQRSGTWLDFPFRGIIRGRWEIREYDVNVGIPAADFLGPEIVEAPQAERDRFKFDGAILDKLPSDVRAATDDDIRVVQETARELVRAQSLARTTRNSVQARAVSDLLRVNRVEGLALGAGFARRFGAGVRAEAAARYGTADTRVRGRVALIREWASGRNLSLRAERSLGDVGLVPEVSLARNSLASQEFGSDWTSPFELQAAVLRYEFAPLRERRWRVSLDGALERHRASRVSASPANGRYEPAPPIDPLSAVRFGIDGRRPTALAFWGSELAMRINLTSWIRRGPGTTSFDAFQRGSVDIDLQRPFGRTRLVVRTIAAANGIAIDSVPVQAEVWLGGPITAPGVGFHALRGTAGISQRVEWQLPTTGPRIPLGRFGRVPTTITFAPNATIAWTNGRTRSGVTTWRGVSPSVGLGVLGAFDLLRLDVAYAPRQRTWLFSIDAARDFWRIL
jgi:hypothetical protein